MTACTVATPTGPPRDTTRRQHYLLRAARAGLFKPGDALDLGCGTGRHVTAPLAAAGYRVTGLDMSARSLEVASLGTSCGDAYEEDWLGVPMYWSSWDHRTNRRLITDAGLEILVDTVETTLEDDQPVAFQWVIASKR